MVSHSSYYLIRDTPEKPITALFLAIDRVFAPSSFWDVGANIGYYSWLVKSTRPDTKVLMFEPDPRNQSLIRQTLERAKIRETNLRPVAVSDSNREMQFQLDRISGLTGTLKSGPESFLRRNWGVLPDAIAVTAVPLDDEIRSREGPELLKIDVEGHESRVLGGGRAMLQRQQPIVVVECLHHGECVVPSLTALNYTCWDAERMTADLGKAKNILALPPRCAEKAENLVSAWHELMN
jgi:FkbM family methyltransferase